MSKYAAWKGSERRVARLLGGQRTGHLGGPSDVATEWLRVQVKHRKKLPQWIVGALAKVRAEAGPKRLGVCILHEHGKRALDNDLVVMSMRDFRDWLAGG